MRSLKAVIRDGDADAVLPVIDQITGGDSEAGGLNGDFTNRLLVETVSRMIDEEDFSFVEY